MLAHAHVHIHILTSENDGKTIMQRHKHRGTTNTAYMLGIYLVFNSVFFSPSTQQISSKQMTNCKWHEKYFLFRFLLRPLFSSNFVSFVIKFSRFFSSSLFIFFFLFLFHFVCAVSFLSVWALNGPVRVYAVALILCFFVLCQLGRCMRRHYARFVVIVHPIYHLLFGSENLITLCAKSALYGNKSSWD